MKKEYNQNELLSALKMQDEDAYTYFFEQYYQRMVIYASGFVPEVEAEDIVVDRLFIAMQRAGNFEIFPLLVGYTYRMIRNACIDHLRKQAFLRKAQLSLSEEEIPTYDVDIQEIEMMDEIYRRWEGLSDNEKKVLEAFYFEGKRIPEIAEAMGIKNNTVSKIKERGIDHLRSDPGEENNKS
jgi:RNA polymerase sigma-70 factor (ECF subfamily)